MVWPDESLDVAAPKLHKAAHFARRATGQADAVVLRDDTVQLFPDAEVVVDAVAFDELSRRAIAAGDVELARRALDLYGGELCPQDRYEEWAEVRREPLRLRHLDLLRLTGRWEELVELEPGDEQAHVELMRRYAAAGDRHAGLRQFERLDRALRRELGVAPGVEACALRDRLLAASGPASSPATELIGRDAELATIERLLREAGDGRARTIIVTGPAGIGKSAVLREARALAEGWGWRVGHGTAAPVEGTWPFAPVIEALADVCRRHPTLLDGLADAYREEIDRVLRGDDATWTGRDRTPTAVRRRRRTGPPRRWQPRIAAHRRRPALRRRSQPPPAALPGPRDARPACGDHRHPPPAARCRTRSPRCATASPAATAPCTSSLVPLDRESTRALIARRLDEP